MKKQLHLKALVLLVLLSATSLFSQVGIGTTTPDADAALDISSTTRGVLLPRIALTMTTSPAPLSTDVAGMVVYNTATVGDVTPGIYYNDGAIWVPAGGGAAPGNDWALAGNAGTTFGTDFVGTTDGTDLAIARNSITKIRVENSTTTFADEIRTRDGATNSGDNLVRIYDSNDDGIIDVYRNNQVQHRLHGNGTTVFNERSANVDFRIESNTATDGFFLEGTDGQVTIGNYGAGAITAGAATQMLAVDVNGNIVEEPLPAGASAWNLTGNAGTTAGVNFLGTTDAQDVLVKANSIERMRVGTTETVFNEISDNNYDFRIESDIEANMFSVDASTNHVFIRQTSPFPTIDMFTAVAPVNDYAVNGYSTGQGNSAVYGQHTTNATGANMNAAAAFDGYGGGFSTQAGWNVGVVGTGDEAGIYGTSGTGSGNRQGGFFQNLDAGATIQATASVAGFTTTGNDYYGGYFDGGQSAGDYAYVGIRIGGTNYKINGGGSVSTTIKDDNNKNRILFCPESPEILFQDYGVGKLINGEAYITIDPLLAKNIHVDKKSPLKVFIQLEGDCNGVYVTDKSKNGFRVKELQGGNSTVDFAWNITATRADEYVNGELDSKHVGVRFPEGPGKMKKHQPGKAKVSQR